MKDQIVSSLKKATELKEINLEFSSRPEFGDYTSNIALRAKNPRKEAQKIVEKLNKDKKLASIVEKIDIAGPGFVNFHLSTKALTSNLSQILDDKDSYGQNSEGKGQTVVIEYSSPNIAKRFSIGHLRSTVIGQALYNLYKFSGYKVIGDNHWGDWGTQFGVLIYMVESTGVDPKKLTVEEWEKLYVEFHTKLDKNPELKDEAREAFKRLELSDKKAKEIWEAALETSIKEYDRIYDLLKVKIDHAYGESFYQSTFDSVINEAKRKGISRKSEGAEIVEFENMPPAILLKSNGTTTYFTRDLATIRYRISAWEPDLIIYEVGSDQILHFRQVFEAAKLLGWAKNREFVHVAHGMVRFPEGKMSTRRGKTVKLEEVLDEAIKKAEKLQKQTASAKVTAVAVGIGAIKYFDLMHAPTSDIIFDWNKIFVLEGNSGPYLQYAYARTQSVLAKAKKFNKFKVESVSNEELMILRYLSRFGEIISMSTKSYSPNILAEYLFNLARSFSTFYNKHKIIGSKEEAFRLSLTAGTGHVLKTGLRLLGIAAPEKM